MGNAEIREDDEMLNRLQSRPQTIVRDIMMPAVFTVESDASLREVADRMVRGQLHQLLVVKPSTKRDIVGIVLATDLLEWVRDRADPFTDHE